MNCSYVGKFFIYLMVVLCDMYTRVRGEDAVHDRRADPCFSIPLFAGSDMELDLLAAAETESDSESNHSNQDNASGRRSVVTAATAGSEAG